MLSKVYKRAKGGYAECGISCTYNSRKFWCGMFRKVYVVVTEIRQREPQSQKSTNFEFK